eukprot:448669-Amphidinium_carterae.1
MACHSPSQQDAALQKGWTFVDPTEQVVVKVFGVGTPKSPAQKLLTDHIQRLAKANEQHQK